MQARETALILIGYQNDYFAKDGILHGVIAEEIQATRMLDHTVHLLSAVKDTSVTIIHTPILFSQDYSELPNPAGLMAQIRDLGAFRRGTHGGNTIPEITRFGSRILTVAGKTGFNAFGGTGLADLLDERDIKNVVLLGVVTSICVDSTGRAASEYGYNVTVLADCHAGRSKAEQDFYSAEVFPLYGAVKDSGTFLRELC
jgi:nicotinamidase-related amidase